VTKKHSPNNIVILTTLVAAGLTLFGGCVPVGGVEPGTIMTDLLLNMAAAFLL